MRNGSTWSVPACRRRPRPRQPSPSKTAGPVGLRVWKWCRAERRRHHFTIPSPHRMAMCGAKGVMDHNGQTPYTDELKADTTGGFASIEFAENPEPRCACVLVLDTSGSMQGAPIEQLNLGLRSFK